MSESQAELLISSIRMMAKDLLGARMELDDLDPTEVAESLNHRFDGGDMPLIEAIMEEAGFTGWLTDKIGRRFYFVNGKRQTQAQMKGQGVDKNQMQNLGTAQAPFQDVKSGKAMSSDAKAKVLSPEDQTKWEQWEKANKADWDRVKGSAAEAKAGKTTVDSIDQFTAMMDKAAGELGKAVTVAKLKEFVRELAPQAGEKFGYSGMKKEDLVGRVKDLVEKLGQANTNGELDKYTQPEEQVTQEPIETESQQDAEVGGQEVQPEEKSQESEIQDDQSGESPVDDLVQDEAQDEAQDTPKPKESKPLHKERLASLKGAYKDNPADTEFLDRVIAGEDPEVVASEVGGVTKGLAKTAQNIITEEHKNAGIDQPEYGKSDEPTQDANETQSEESQVDTEDTQVEGQPPEDQPEPDQMQSFSSDNMDFDEKVTADQVLGMRDKEFGSVLGTMSHEEKLELADELSSKGDELSKQLEKEGKELRDSEELKKINALYDQVVNASIKDAPEDFNDLEDEEDVQPEEGQGQEQAEQEEPEFDKGEAEPLQGQDAAEDDATNFKYMTDEEFAKEDPASKGFELKDGNWVHKDYPDVSFKDRGGNQAEPAEPEPEPVVTKDQVDISAAISKGGTIDELMKSTGMDEKGISDYLQKGIKYGTIEDYVDDNGDVAYRLADNGSSDGVEADPKSPPPPKQDLSYAIYDIFNDLHDREFSESRLVPIYKVREEIRKRYGNAAASHKVFDQVLKDLRINGHLTFLPSSDRKNITSEMMNAGLTNKNPNLHSFYIEHPKDFLGKINSKPVEKPEGFGKSKAQKEYIKKNQDKPINRVPKENELYSEINDLIEEEFGYTRMLSVPRLKEKLKERFGDKADDDDFLRKSLNDLRNKGKIKLSPSGESKKGLQYPGGTNIYWIEVD